MSVPSRASTENDGDLEGQSTVNASSSQTDDGANAPEPPPERVTDPAGAAVERAAGPPDEAPKKKKKKKKLDTDLYVRVMAGFEVEHENPRGGQAGEENTEYEFFLQQARAWFNARYLDRVRVRISADFADALRTTSPQEVPYLRNAYAGVRVHDAVRIRVGRFKRPFSRLELRSVRLLPFRGRGLFNSRVIEDRQWGDRALGLMLWGKLKPARLVWRAGLSNPGVRTPGIDATGRVQVRATRWLSVGGGGVFKRTTNGMDDNVDAGAVGGDVHVEVAGLDFVVEADAAQDYLVSGRPWTLGVVAWASYTAQLPRKFQLQPVLLGEGVDANLDFTQSEALRIVAGFNALWSDIVRVMPQAEVIRALGTVTARNPWADNETY